MIYTIPSQLMGYNGYLVTLGKTRWPSYRHTFFLNCNSESSVAPPFSQGCLGVSADILSVRTVEEERIEHIVTLCYVGRGQDAMKYSTVLRSAPTGRNYLHQNVRSVRFEKQYNSKESSWLAAQVSLCQDSLSRVSETREVQVLRTEN